MSIETFKAAASMIAILAVNVANMIGLSLDADFLTQSFLCAFAIATLIWGVWKNHNFTQAAQDAQNILNALKDGSGYGLGDDEK